MRDHDDRPRGNDDDMRGLDDHGRGTATAVDDSRPPDDALAEERDDALAVEHDDAVLAETAVEARTEPPVDSGSTVDASAAESTVDTQPAGSSVETDSAVDGPAPEGMLPGTVPPPPAPVLWSGDAARSVRERWNELQLRFLDDPRATAAAADALVAEAIDGLTASLAEQRGDLGAWQSTDQQDTEQLRVVVQGYRDFLERILAL